MSGIGLGVGLGSAQGMLGGESMLVDGVLVVTTLQDGSLEITAADGDLTITVLAPSPFEGVYATTTAQLQLGPVNLVPAEISGQGLAGETLSVVPGLWIFDAALAAPDLNYQWTMDGSDLSGEVATDLIIPRNGADYAVTETLSQAGAGQNAVASNTISVPYPSQSVTIPAGTVTEDQTNFPMRFDMSDLSPMLWDALRVDGGNLRATNASDTENYPIDVVWIDPAAQRGTVFVRQDLQSATDVTFDLRVRNTDVLAEDPSAANGRNAVWADYLSVLAFPDRTDRTGQHSVVEAGTFANDYVLEKVSGDIQMHQGLTWDGTHWFVVDTNQIKKFDAQWNLVQTMNDPIGLSALPGVNHLGDPCIHNGELLIPLEVWPSGPFTNQHIAVYSTDDLSFIRSHDISAAGREASSFAINPADGNLYCTDYTNGADIPYFTTTGTYLGTLTLSQTVNQLQGIVFHDGKMFLTSDSTDQLFEALPDGTVTPSPVFTSLLGGSFEGIASDGTDLYVLIDSTPSCVYRLLDATKSDVLPFADNSLKVSNIPSQNAWTASVTTVPYALPHNGAVISVVREGGETNRATAAMRTSSNPNSYNGWSNTDSWMAPGATREPQLTEQVRMSYGYSGTGDRKLLLDGAPYAVGSGVTARPGGSLMSWFTGAEDSSPTENASAGLSFAFLFDGYASDARLAAEFANLNNPSNFYITNSG